MNPILIIHAIGNKERQDNILKQFASQSIQPGYTIVPAVMERVGRYGIAKSHKLCVKWAKEKGWKTVTILEDDVDFLNVRSLENYLVTMNNLPDDWEIYTGGLYSGEIAEPETTLGYSRIIPPMSGLHLYTVHEKYYDTFLSASETMNIDFEISEILKATMYTAYPLLVKEVGGFYSYNAGKVVNYGEFLCQKYRCIK